MGRHHATVRRGDRARQAGGRHQREEDPAPDRRRRRRAARQGRRQGQAGRRGRPARRNPGQGESQHRDQVARRARGAPGPLRGGARQRQGRRVPARADVAQARSRDRAPDERRAEAVRDAPHGARRPEGAAQGADPAAQPPDRRHAGAGSRQGQGAGSCWPQELEGVRTPVEAEPGADQPGHDPGARFGAHGGRTRGPRRLAGAEPRPHRRAGAQDPPDRPGSQHRGRQGAGRDPRQEIGDDRAPRRRRRSAEAHRSRVAAGRQGVPAGTSIRSVAWSRPASRSC